MVLLPTDGLERLRARHLEVNSVGVLNCGRGPGGREAPSGVGLKGKVPHQRFKSLRPSLKEPQSCDHLKEAGLTHPRIPHNHTLDYSSRHQMTGSRSDPEQPVKHSNTGPQYPAVSTCPSYTSAVGVASGAGKP